MLSTMAFRSVVRKTHSRSTNGTAPTVDRTIVGRLSDPAKAVGKPVCLLRVVSLCLCLVIWCPSFAILEGRRSRQNCVQALIEAGEQSQNEEFRRPQYLGTVGGLPGYNVPTKGFRNLGAGN